MARDAGQQRVNVLGVGVDPITVEELHMEIGRLIRGGEHALVLNGNAHCLNLAYQDAVLRNFLNSAEIVFCDGAGVMLAARLLGRRIPERITYADWMWRLAAFAASEGHTLFFLGACPGVAEEAARRLTERFPALKIAGIHHGYFDHATGSSENEGVIQEINAAKPHILVVGFGMPRQERWLMANWDRVDANVALAGGAVFDYVSGRLRRGPRLLTDNGFEWLARLLVEPARLWRRYLLGNPVFVLRVMRQRLSTDESGTRSRRNCVRRRLGYVLKQHGLPSGAARGTIHGLEVLRYSAPVGGLGLSAGIICFLVPRDGGHRVSPYGCRGVRLCRSR